MSRQTRDRMWFSIHSWIGLKLSLFMSFILITGTIAVFSYEIDWLLNESMRAGQWVEHEQVAWGAAYDAAVAQYPGVSISGIVRFQDPWFALEAGAMTRWGERIRIWLEPSDGAFIGVTAWYNVQRFFRQVHRRLTLPNNIGIPLVTVTAFPLLLSLVAGFVVYKKFWRGFLRMPRWHRKTRIWAGDLHRLAGLWSSWFVALIALSSIWYFAEELGAARRPCRGRTKPLLRGNPPLPAGFNGDTLDRAAANARAAMPGLEIRRILFPVSPRGALIIQGDHSAVLVRPRANTVYIDPLNLNVVGRYRGEELDWHNRLSEAADPLHFGYFGGFITKILWFILGVIMSGLAITGVVIYTRRLRRAVTGEPPAKTRPGLKAGVEKAGAAV